MVEGHVIYDLLPKIDLQAYAAWAKKATEAILKAPGLVEFRAQQPTSDQNSGGHHLCLCSVNRFAPASRA